MKVLVCGGAGYVGSHAVAEMLARGYDVAVVDNLANGHRAAVFPEARFYQGDISDEAFMDKVFQQTKAEAVMDFAAFSLVGESVSVPQKYYENNVIGTFYLVNSMLRNEVPYIVFSSTAATYGEPEQIPLLETALTNPANPYGDTKLAVEKMFKWYDNAYNFKYMTLRYFNVAGAHKSGAIGEDHGPETHLIPNVIKAALGLTPGMKLFGDDYDTPDGTCVRDYIHVTDLADAHILALEKLKSGGASNIYNLGNGKGFSNREIIDAVRRVSGRPVQVEVLPRRAGDPSTLVASSEKIKRELGWNPQNAELDQIIASAWKWHESHPNGFGDQ